jgi:hypothetical protein
MLGSSFQSKTMIPQICPKAHATPNFRTETVDRSDADRDNNRNNNRNNTSVRIPAAAHQLDVLVQLVQYALPHLFPPQEAPHGLLVLPARMGPFRFTESLT